MPRERLAARFNAGAIELRMTPGAVVVAGRGDGVLFEKAYGTMTYADNAAAMTTDTVFDLASLSKVIGGAASIGSPMRCGSSRAGHLPGRPVRSVRRSRCPVAGR